MGAGPGPSQVSPAHGDGGSADDGGEDSDASGGAEPVPDGTRPIEITRSVVDEPEQPRGLLSGMQYRKDDAHPSHYGIQALFETTRGQWDGCTQVRSGECWYYDCPPGSAPYLPSVPLQNAGTLSVTTASDPATTLQVGLLYDFWYEVESAGELWTGLGKTVTFSALGKTVPPFTLAVQSPPTVALTSLNGALLPKSIARRDGASLTWTSSGPGVAYFLLYGSYDQKLAASCEFDAASGAGQLPAVLLQELAPGPDYALIFHGISRAHSKVNGWQLDASLLGYGGAISPDDYPTLELR